MMIARETELAEAGEVVRDRDMLAVGGDDFNGGVVRGHVTGIVDEPNEPTGGMDDAAGAGISVGGGAGGGVGKEAEGFEVCVKEGWRITRRGSIHWSSCHEPERWERPTRKSR